MCDLSAVHIFQCSELTLLVFLRKTSDLSAYYSLFILD